MEYRAHPSTYVDEGAQIGENTRIWHFCHIESGAIIGKNCTMGQNVYVASGAIIGNSCKIQNNVSVYKGVIIEDDVFISPSVVFGNVLNPRAFIERKKEFRKTLIEKGATIGANSTIIGGVSIGEYAFIGAGSIVTRDVKAYTLVYGVPAKFVQKINELAVW